MAHWTLARLRLQADPLTRNFVAAIQGFVGEKACVSLGSTSANVCVEPQQELSLGGVLFHEGFDGVVTVLMVLIGLTTVCCCYCCCCSPKARCCIPKAPPERVKIHAPSSQDLSDPVMGVILPVKDAADAAPPPAKAAPPSPKETASFVQTAPGGSSFQEGSRVKITPKLASMAPVFGSVVGWIAEDGKYNVETDKGFSIMVDTSQLSPETALDA